MKIKRVYLLVLVLICLISNSLITSASEASKNDLPFSQEILAETLPEALQYCTTNQEQLLLKKRVAAEETNLCNVAFERIDGSTILYSFEKPIKYISKDGKIHDKSTKLTKTFSGFSTLNNDVQVDFPNNLKNGISLSYENIHLRLIPEGFALDAKQSEQNILYSNDDTLIAFAYTPLLDGFKENIILRERIPQEQLTFRLITNGLSLSQDEDAIFLLSNGKHLATIPSLYLRS